MGRALEMRLIVTKITIDPRFRPRVIVIHIPGVIWQQMSDGI